MRDHAAWEDGILISRPANPTAAVPEGFGTSPLRLGRDRDGLLRVPKSLARSEAAPLLVMLHGAGASSSDAMPMVRDVSDRHGVVVLAPDSRDRTWDMLLRAYGPDVAFLDRALDGVFARHAIDPGRIAIAGFSDGASYALSLGIINGALFRDIFAFSPGFAAPTRTENSPRIFLCHGREDRVLPINRCGRRTARRWSATGSTWTTGSSPARTSSRSRWSRRHSPDSCRELGGGGPEAIVVPEETCPGSVRDRRRLRCRRHRGPVTPRRRPLPSSPGGLWRARRCSRPAHDGAPGSCRASARPRR